MSAPVFQVLDKYGQLVPPLGLSDAEVRARCIVSAEHRRDAAIRKAKEQYEADVKFARTASIAAGGHVMVCAESRVG